MCRSWFGSARTSARRDAWPSCAARSDCTARGCARRTSAALVLAGLQAEGTTEVEQIHHIERGYADLVGDLHALGAEIRLREA